MIETLIERLIAALQENTAALTGRVQTELPLAEQVDLVEAKKLASEIAAKRPRKSKTDTVDVKIDGLVVPLAPPEPAKIVQLTVEDFQKVGHAIIDARHARKLEPANAPIKALAKEYGVTKISDTAGTDKAGEVYAKLQAVLKESAA